MVLALRERPGKLESIDKYFEILIVRFAHNQYLHVYIINIVPLSEGWQDDPCFSGM